MDLPPLCDRRFKQAKVDVFWPRVIVGGPKECWPWIGSIGPRGYGLIQRDNVRTTAHRVAYELAVEKLPKGMHLHHRCGNRVCCNPKHMEPLTPAAHMRIHQPGELDCRTCGGEKGAVLYRGKMRYVCHPCEAERKRQRRQLG